MDTCDIKIVACSAQDCERTSATADFEKATNLTTDGIHMHKLIEKRLRNHFPILLNDTKSIDHNEYRREFSTFIDGAISISSPALSAETVRYQSILLYITLLFAAVHFLELKGLKIADLDIPVSVNFLKIYSAFIFVVALAFGAKAILDFNRWGLIRRKHTDALKTLDGLVDIGEHRKDIEQHYFNQVCELIGDCYEPFSEATAKVLGKENRVKNRLSFPSVDISKAQSFPELRPVIEAKENWLNDLKTELEVQVQEFNKECQPILLAHAEYNEKYNTDPLPPKLDNSFKLINLTFSKWLKPWFTARNNLIDESSSKVFKNFGSSEELLLREELSTIINKLERAKWIYATVEVIFPILFAVITIGYIYHNG
jgi:hypothetical protein